MSTENETQNIPIPEKEPEVSQEKAVIITCATCDVTIDGNQTKLVCKNDQCRAITCDACTKLMIEVMFGQPVLNYPLKCGACDAGYDMVEVDQLLTKHVCYEQYVAFVLPLFWSKDCLNENETLAQCPFCPYAEIHTTDACPLQFFTCQQPSCGKKSCLICLHEIIDDESIHRSRCVELQSYKQMIEIAIDTGSKQQCPHCQLTGIKDDGCTHMTCERCGLTWCYLCGMKEEECLVDNGEEPSFGAHNNEWEAHEGRCPMSLVSIHELDDRWPQTDQDCLEFFHRYRTLCQLYDVMKTVGEERLYELDEAFGIINGSGYTINEIKDYENRILINYQTDES